MFAALLYAIYGAVVLPSLYNPSAFVVATFTYFGTKQDDIIIKNELLVLAVLPLSPGVLCLSMHSIALSWIKMTEEVSRFLDSPFSGSVKTLKKTIYVSQFLLFIIMASLLITNIVPAIFLVLAFCFIILAIVVWVGRRRFLHVIRTIGYGDTGIKSFHCVLSV